MSIGRAPFLNVFYWSVVNLQYCVSFKCTTKWTYVFFFSFFSIIRYFKILSIVPCVICALGMSTVSSFTPEMQAGHHSFYRSYRTHMRRSNIEVKWMGSHFFPSCRWQNFFLNMVQDLSPAKAALEGRKEAKNTSKTLPWGFPSGAVVKSPPANAGDTGSSPGPGRSHMPQSN